MENEVEVFAGPTKLKNWQFVAVVNGEFYSASSCRMKSSAKNHIKADLKESALNYPEGLEQKYDQLAIKYPKICR